MSLATHIFTAYFRDGRRVVMQGHTFDESLRQYFGDREAYRQQTLLEMYRHGVDHSYGWDSARGVWSRPLTLHS